MKWVLICVFFLPICHAFNHWNFLWKSKVAPARHPTVLEQRGKTRCSFQRASGKPADCQIERDTQEFLLKYLPSSASVFEFGARYGTTSCMIASIQKNSGKNCFLVMTLTEGKNRHIKKVCEHIGHPVIKLQRTHFGGLNLTGLPLGACRFLNPKEIKSLKKLVAVEQILTGSPRKKK